MTETKLLPVLSVNFHEAGFHGLGIAEAWSLDLCWGPVHGATKQQNIFHLLYLEASPRVPILTILPVGSQCIILEEANHTSLILGWQC